MDWVDFILKLGAIATAVTAVGRLLISAYKKYISAPHDRAIAEIQKQNSRDLTDSLMPLTISIEKLNYLLDESRADRKKLHEQDREHDIALDNHEVRISVLEDWRKEKRN